MDESALSQALLTGSFAFIMVMCRVGAAVMLLPGLAEEGMPTRVRVGLVFALTILLVPTVAPLLPKAPASVPALFVMICGELFAGGFLGWLARLIALALPAAGQVISLSTGMSSVLQPDANFGAQTASIGRLFGIAAPVLLLASGAYRLPLSALADSYTAWPAGAAPPTGDVLETVVRAVGAHFALALRLASPFMLIGPGVADGARAAVAPGAAVADLFRRIAGTGAGRAAAAGAAVGQPGACLAGSCRRWLWQVTVSQAEIWGR